MRWSCFRLLVATIGALGVNFAQAQTDDLPIKLTLQLGHSRGVDIVVYSPDGMYAVSGCEDHSIKLWKSATGRLIRIFEGHSNNV